MPPREMEPAPPPFERGLPGGPGHAPIGPGAGEGSRAEHGKVQSLPYYTCKIPLRSVWRTTKDMRSTTVVICRRQIHFQLCKRMHDVCATLLILWGGVEVAGLEEEGQVLG